MFLIRDFTAPNGVVNDGLCFACSVCVCVWVCSSTEEGFETRPVQEVHHGPDQEPRVVQEVSPLSIDTLFHVHLLTY